MVLFRYTAFSKTGKREEGEVDFASETQAWEHLGNLGLTVVDLTAVSGDQERKQSRRRLGSKKLSLGLQADVAEQLAVLFSARLRAIEITYVVKAAATDSRVRDCFEKIGKLLADGAAFEVAFEKAAAGFDPLFPAMIRVSQSSSDPGPILKNLALHLRRQHKLNAQLSGALVYPLILLVGGIGVFLLVVLYLAPALEPMFVSLGREMPPSLGFFLSIGKAIKEFGLEIAILLALLLLSGMVFSDQWKRVLRSTANKVPILGPIMRNSALARLTRSLHMMLASGIPVVTALHESASNLNTDLFASRFEEAAVAIEGGTTATSVFQSDAAIPVMFRELFDIGERTNNLSEITGSLATALEDTSERQSQQAVQLVTPIITLVMGSGLALLIYSIMDAILSVNDLAF